MSLHRPYLYRHVNFAVCSSGHRGATVLLLSGRLVLAAAAHGLPVLTAAVNAVRPVALQLGVNPDRLPAIAVGPSSMREKDTDDFFTSSVCRPERYSDMELRLNVLDLAHRLVHGYQTLFSKGPRFLLWAGLRAFTYKKVTVRVVPNLPNFCVIIYSRGPLSSPTFSKFDSIFFLFTFFRDSVIEMNSFSNGLFKNHKFFTPGDGNRMGFRNSRILRKIATYIRYVQNRAILAVQKFRKPVGHEV